MAPSRLSAEDGNLTTYLAGLGIINQANAKIDSIADQLSIPSAELYYSGISTHKLDAKSHYLAVLLEVQ